LPANGDELNLNLPEFARPQYFFSNQAFWYFGKVMEKKIANIFVSWFATFSLQNVTSLDVGLGGKI